MAYIIKRAQQQTKESIVYKCTACTIRQLKKVYLGLTEGEFETCYYKHLQSFRTKSYPNTTTLSSYVWEVKTKQNETLGNSSISTSILKSNQTMHVTPI